jgi:hypothetical protein
MKLSSGFRDGFLANIHEILDLAILNLILTITDSRLLMSLKKLKFGAPLYACKKVKKVSSRDHEFYCT